VPPLRGGTDCPAWAQLAAAAPDNRWNSLTPDPAWSFALYRLYNIGSHRPIEVGVGRFVDWFREDYRISL